MGFTRYFETHKDGIPVAAWEKIAADTRKLLSNLPAHSTNAGGYHSDDPLEIAFEDDQPDKAPEVSDSLIRFNGKGELGHDTFYFERAPEMPDYQKEKGRNAVFAFCKTARKPYDLVVCGVLLVINRHAHKYVSTSSDGDREDWTPAVEWVAATLGSFYPLPASLWVGGKEPLPDPVSADVPHGTIEDEPDEDGTDEDGYEDDMESWNPEESGDEDEPDEDENPKPEPVTTSHTFVVDVKEFRAALELSVTEKKAYIPALAMVCLVPQGSSLQVLSTDLDKWTVTQVPAMIDDGAGNVLLPHRKTLELLKGETGILRITAKVTTQGDNFSHVWVGLEVGGCQYDVPGMNPDTFPQVPEIPAVGFDVSGSDLKASLGRIMVAISTEESRYTINGALFECNRRKLLLVGTDGHRLALDSVPLREVRKGKALIHRDALAWVAKYSSGDVVITLGEEYSFFHVAQTVFITRNLKGNFPNYKVVTPRMDAMKMTTTFPSGDELAKTLGKVAHMADERSGAVKWAINGTCVLSASSSEMGKASATVKASIVHSDEMPEIVTGFNTTYVLDALKVAGKSPVVLSLKDNQSAGVFTVPSLPEYSYVIMPMRV